MPSYIASEGVLGCKVVGYYPENAKRGQPTVTAFLFLIDPDTGEPISMIDATSLTEWRTGGIVAAAVRNLAPENERSIGLFGSGALARTSIASLKRVWPLDEVHLFSRSAPRRQAFASAMQEEFGIPVWACDSPTQVLESARVIVCATASATPVFEGSSLRAGSLVVSIGANTPDTRELDEDTILGSQLVVESREATLTECGELIIPIAAGRMGEEIIHAEMGELLAGHKPLVRADPDTVVFKSTGLAVQDLLVAQSLVDRAAEAGVGNRIEVSA